MTKEELKQAIKEALEKYKWENDLPKNIHFICGIDAQGHVYVEFG